MQQPIINIKNICKSFAHDKVSNQVLKKISFTINKGEYVAITGPSGCGKSTLLNILGLMDTADEGEYFLNGEDVLGFSANQRAHFRNQYIGFVFQSFNLIDELTVAENVALPLKYRNMKAKARLNKAQECLEWVGLAEKAGYYPSQLSGGQQQRVSIARALSVGSGILLVDEPTGNLDSTNGDIVMKLLAELHAQGTTICLVTHDPRYSQMAERQINLLDGHVMSEQAPSLTGQREIA